MYMQSKTLLKSYIKISVSIFAVAVLLTLIVTVANVISREKMSRFTLPQIIITSERTYDGRPYLESRDLLSAGQAYNVGFDFMNRMLKGKRYEYYLFDVNDSFYSADTDYPIIVTFYSDEYVCFVQQHWEQQSVALLPTHADAHKYDELFVYDVKKSEIKKICTLSDNLFCVDLTESYYVLFDESDYTVRQYGINRGDEIFLFDLSAEADKELDLRFSLADGIYFSQYGRENKVQIRPKNK